MKKYLVPATLLALTLTLSACSTAESNDSSLPSPAPSNSNSYEIENTINEKVIFESHEDMGFKLDAATLVPPQEWVQWYNSKIEERNKKTANETMILEGKSFSAPSEDSEHAEVTEGVFLELYGITQKNQKVLIDGVLTAPGAPEENKNYKLVCETFTPPNCATQDLLKTNPEWEKVGDDNIPPGVSIVGFPEFPDNMPTENTEYYISEDEKSSKFIIKNEETEDISYFFFDDNGNTIVTKTVLTGEGKLRNDAYQAYTVSEDTQTIEIPEIIKK